MSLEEKLAANTAALEKNTAVMERMLATSGAKPAATTAATKPAATGAATKPAATKPAAKKAVTVEDMTAKATTFLKTGDTDVRLVRKDQMRQLIEYYGVEKFTAIPLEHGAQAIDALDTFTAGGEPEFLQAPDNDDAGDGEDDAMV